MHNVVLLCEKKICNQLPSHISSAFLLFFLLSVSSSVLFLVFALVDFYLVIIMI